MTAFGTVTADPPWAEYGGGGRGAQNHYPLLSTPEICNVMHRMMVDAGGISESAHLWVWVTDNYLRDGLGVLEALGFRYVRTMVWVKVKPPGSRVDVVDLESLLQIGLGQYARGSHELVLLGVRGPARVPAPKDRPPSVIFETRGRHSAKPARFYDIVEAMSPGPRLELFAREPRPGWTVKGNEVE